MINCFVAHCKRIIASYLEEGDILSSLFLRTAGKNLHVVRGMSDALPQLGPGCLRGGREELFQGAHGELKLLRQRLGTLTELGRCSGLCCGLWGPKGGLSAEEKEKGEVFGIQYSTGTQHTHTHNRVDC